MPATASVAATPRPLPSAAAKKARSVHGATCGATLLPARNNRRSESVHGRGSCASSDGGSDPKHARRYSAMSGRRLIGTSGQNTARTSSWPASVTVNELTTSST